MIALMAQNSDLLTSWSAYKKTPCCTVDRLPVETPHDGDNIICILHNAFGQFNDKLLPNLTEVSYSLTEQFIADTISPLVS